MLGFVQSLFQGLPLPQLLYHLIEALPKLADLVRAFYRHGYGEITGSDLFHFQDQPLDRVGVASGKEDYQDGPESEYDAGRQKAPDKVVVLNLADVVEKEIDFDIPKLFVSDDYRHYKVVRFLGGQSAHSFSRCSLQPLLEFFQVPFLADLLRIGGVNDLPFGVDDIYLVDPFLPCLFQVISQLGGLNFGFRGEILDTLLEDFGDRGGTLLNLAYELGLAYLVQGEQRQHRQDQQGQHYDDKFCVKIHEASPAAIYTSGRVLKQGECPIICSHAGLFLLTSTDESNRAKDSRMHELSIIQGVVEL